MIQETKTVWNNFKYKGPSSSKDFNEFIENAFSDFTSLKRMAVILAEETSNLLGKTARESMALTSRLSSLTEQQRDNGSVCYANLSDSSVVEWLDRNGDTIPASTRLHHNPIYGYISLPCTFYDYLAIKNEAGYVVPDYVDMQFESIYEANNVRGDDLKRVLSGFDKEVWERVSILNIGDTPVSGSLYIMVPEQLMIRPSSNFIVLNPFPPLFVDFSIYYTTDISPTLSSGGASWNTFPDYISYIGDGNVAQNAPNLMLQFPATDITALKIDMIQRNSFFDGSSYVFSYGIRHLGLGYANPSTPSGMARITVQKPSGNFTSISEEAVVEYLNLAAPYDTGNISTYCWIDPLDATKAYIELSISNQGTLSSPAGNILSYSPQIASIGVQYT